MQLYGGKVDYTWEWDYQPDGTESDGGREEYTLEFDYEVSGTFPTPGQKTIYVKVHARVVNPEQGYIGDAAIGATRQALEFQEEKGRKRGQVVILHF